MDLKNRKPVSVTRTIIQPVRIEKETDTIQREGDSIFIKDYYPNKLNPFLTYKNRFSLATNTGNSSFNFEPITLTQVVTEKEGGLYQIDFKGPDFLEVNSLDIQTTPMAPPPIDNWGTVIGLEYGKNFDTQKNVFEINAYQRYKKFYFGGSFDTQQTVKGGLKFEF